jgi:hypothetical protein
MMVDNYYEKNKDRTQSAPQMQAKPDETDGSLSTRKLELQRNESARGGAIKTRKQGVTVVDAVDEAGAKLWSN